MQQACQFIKNRSLKKKQITLKRDTVSILIKLNLIKLNYINKLRDIFTYIFKNLEINDILHQYFFLRYNIRELRKQNVNWKNNSKKYCIF